MQEKSDITIYYLIITIFLYFIIIIHLIILKYSYSYIISNLLNDDKQCNKFSINIYHNK